MIISAERRRKNIGERYKPCNCTYPVCQPRGCNEQGIFPCWNRRYLIWMGSEKMENLGHISCSTPNVIRCKIHKDACYVGSAKHLNLTWINQKSKTQMDWSQIGHEAQKSEQIQCSPSCPHSRTAEWHHLQLSSNLRYWSGFWWIISS